MANSTLLQIVQQAAGELGLSIPMSVASNQSIDVVQLFYLANGLGNDLMRDYEWQQINRAYRFTTQYLTTTGTWTTSAATITGIPTTAALSAVTWQAANGVGIPQDTIISSVDSATQVTLSQNPTTAGTASAISFGQTAYVMPSDYDRPVDRTNWDKTKHWEMLGPCTAQQWEWLKSGYISTGPRIRWRILGQYFQIWPVVIGNEYLGFEYISKNWVLSTTATNNVPDKAAFSADTDTCIFSDRLMMSGLKLRYFDAKGFDSTSLQLAYESQLSIAKANDSGSATLSMAPRQSDVLITWSNIPDSGYGT